MMNRHAGKLEERQNGSNKRIRHRHDMIHMSKEEEYYTNCYREPVGVPFKWEIQPGVPKPPKIEGESTELYGGQSSPATLKLPPSVHSAPSADTISSSSKSTTASASPKKDGCHFSCNLPNLYRQLSLQGGDTNGDDGGHAIIRSNFELNSNKKLISPASNKDHLFHSDNVQLATAPSSHARRALVNLLLGVYSCSSIVKSFFRPSLKQKEKSEDSSTEIGLYASTSQEPAGSSALKKKSNIYSGNFAAGIEQSRAETDALPPSTRMDSASTILL